VCRGQPLPWLFAQQMNFQACLCASETSKFEDNKLLLGPIRQSQCKQRMSHSGICVGRLDTWPATSEFRRGGSSELPARLRTRPELRLSRAWCEAGNKLRPPQNKLINLNHYTL
jgi:hypothetical protein